MLWLLNRLSYDLNLQSLNRACSKQVREEDIHERGAEKSVWLKVHLHAWVPCYHWLWVTCMHLCTLTWAHIDSCTSANTHAYTYSQRYTLICTHTDTHPHLPVYPCTHMHTGTSTHTHILPAKQVSRFHEAGTMVYLLVYENSVPGLVHTN